MSDQSLPNLLNKLLAAETHGLLARANDLEPYVTSRTYQAWRRILDLAHLTQARNQALTDMLRSMGVEPTPAVFLVNVADDHFMDVPHLLPKLAAETRAQVALYREALAAADRPDLRDRLQSLLDESQSHLTELDTLAANQKPVTQHA